MAAANLVKVRVIPLIILLLILSGPALADSVIRENQRPDPDSARILLDPPDRPYRTIAILADEIKFRHSSEDKAIRNLAKKAHKMGADAVIPADTESRSGPGVAAPVGSGFVVINKNRRTVKVRAIKFTDQAN